MSMPSQPTDNAAWHDANLAEPHKVADKAARVQRMFSAIAPRYDLNNRVHSMGRDQAWRRKTVAVANVQPGDTILDVACGTGDLTMAFANSKAARVVGVDFTYDMLRVANNKRSHAAASLAGYYTGDAMALPFADQTANVVSIAFGIRNVADPVAAIGEFYRVLRPGGRVVILEFSLPRNPIMRGLYNFYFRHVMPRTATLIARDRSGAYRYLPQSVNTFIDRPQMVSMLGEAGFERVEMFPLTMGIAVIYRGIKPGG